MEDRRTGTKKSGQRSGRTGNKGGEARPGQEGWRDQVRERKRAGEKGRSGGAKPFSGGEQNRCRPGRRGGIQDSQEGNQPGGQGQVVLQGYPEHLLCSPDLVVYLALRERTDRCNLPVGHLLVAVGNEDPTPHR